MSTKKQISQVLTDYIEEADLYAKALSITLLISENQGGIKTDGRGIRATKIFNRQTLTGMSLLTILPKPTISNPDGYLWDVGSIASLTRNIIEGYLSLHYFGIERVSEQEADLRFQLLQLHKNIEWYSIRKAYIDSDEAKKFESGITEQKDTIRHHDFLSHLKESQRKKALNWYEMYKTKADFESDLPICKNLTGTYRLLSNLAHALPLSFERVNNEKGRGLDNDIDVSYCLTCVMLARKFLAASTTGMGDYFDDSIGRKFTKELTEMRDLTTKGFEEDTVF